MRVCLGGTFNPVHKGHQMLFDTALKVAGSDGKVVIGVTDGSIIQHKDKVPPVASRIQAVKRRFTDDVMERVELVVISDRFGPAVTDDFDAIVVSLETFGVGGEINKKRVENGLVPLLIVVVPIFFADDGKPLCSSRIRAGEIDAEGKVIGRFLT